MTIKNLLAKVNPKAVGYTAAGTVSALAMAVPAFASSTPDNLPSVAITSDMLKPLVDGVVANIGVILPVGIGLFAIFLGIRILPGMISRFVRA